MSIVRVGERYHGYRASYPILHETFVKDRHCMCNAKGNTDFPKQCSAMIWYYNNTVNLYFQACLNYCMYSTIYICFHFVTTAHAKMKATSAKGY